MSSIVQGQGERINQSRINSRHIDSHEDVMGFFGSVTVSITLWLWIQKSSFLDSNPGYWLNNAGSHLQNEGADKSTSKSSCEV